MRNPISIAATGLAVLWLETVGAAAQDASPDATGPGSEARDGQTAPSQGAPAGWGTQAEALTVWQGNAALSGGGQFSAYRGVLRGSLAYRWNPETSVGLSVSAGRFDYRFDGAVTAPWGDITDLRISIPARFTLGDNATVILVPSLRYDYETGSGPSGGRTYGIFAGVAFRVSERLTIGPAFGLFTRLEDNSPEVFPALLVDWEFADRWLLSTGTGLGATQGPGLSISYAVSDALRISVTARRENVRFRLNGTGPAPNGIGQDSSIPVVAGLTWEPNPGVSLSAFAGAEFDGVLQLDDASGRMVSRQTYNSAPLAGLTLRLRF